VQKDLQAKVSKAITQVLQEYGVVVIPGFGGFSLVNKPSFISSNKHKLFAPTSEIKFLKNLKQNDFVLVQHFSKLNNESHSSSIEIINEWKMAVVNQLKAFEKFSITNLGMLTLKGNKIIFVKQLSNTLVSKEQYGLPTIQLKKLNKTLDKSKNLSLLIKSAFLFFIASNLILLGAFADTKSEKWLASMHKVYDSVFPTYTQNTAYTKRSQSCLLDLEKFIELDLITSQFEAYNNELLSISKPRVRRDELLKVEHHDNAFAYLIKGCFKNKNNAINLAKKFTESGLNSGVVFHKGLYKVFLKKDNKKDVLWSNLTSYQYKYGVDVWVLD